MLAEKRWQRFIPHVIFCCRDLQLLVGVRGVGVDLDEGHWADDASVGKCQGGRNLNS